MNDKAETSSMESQSPTPSPSISPLQQPVSPPSPKSSKVPIIITTVTITLFVVAMGFFGYQYLQTKKQSVSTTVQTEETQPVNVTSVPIIPNKISFLRKGDIWLADEGGLNQKQVTTNGTVQDFYWVPKTNEIVFISKPIDNSKKTQVDVTLLNIDTGNQQVIHTRTYNSGYGLREYKLSVSPDGKKVAFNGDLVDQNLIVHDISSNTEKEITTSGVTPFFSSNGQFLAGISNGNIFTYLLTDNSSSQITNFDDSSAYKTSPSSYSTYESPLNVIDWLHNNNMILYYFGNSGRGSFGFNVVDHLNGIDANSKNAVNLTQSGIGDVDVYYDQSADGKTIYYKVEKNTLLNPNGTPVDLNSITNLSGYQLTQQGYQTKMTATLMAKNISTNQSVVIPVSQSVSSGPSVNDINIVNLKVSPTNNILSYEWTPLPTIDNTSPNHEIWEMNTDGTNNHKIIDNASNPKWKN